MVFDYFGDFAASIRHDWSNGHNWTEQARAKVEALEDMSQIDLDSIETFYQALEQSSAGAEDHQSSGY